MCIAHMQKTTLFHGCHPLWALLHLWRERLEAGTSDLRPASCKDVRAKSVKSLYLAEFDVAEGYAVPCVLMDDKVYQTVLEVSTVQFFGRKNSNYKVVKDMCVPFI